MSIIEKAIEKLNKKSMLEKADERAQQSSQSPKVEAQRQQSAQPQDSQPAKNKSVDARSQKSVESQPQKMIKLRLDILRENGMVVPDNTRSSIADEYRLIKRPLIMNAFGQGASIVDNANLIMVSSSVPGEGKTFTAVNLAMSIAMERDKHVLLVDADVARPSVSRLLKLPPSPGLIDMLVDHEVSFQDVVLKTDVPTLSILPSGRAHPHSTELLAGNEMGNLAHELSQRYSDRIVIFDSPPLLATTEAGVLANHMGQVVMVVESGKTQQKTVKEALSRLTGPEIIGFVLNKTIGGVMGGEYDYSYGNYYYGGSMTES